MTAALKVAEALEGNGLKKLDIGGLRSALDYNAETGHLTWKIGKGPVQAGTRAGYLRRDGYRSVQFGGVQWQEHCLVWAYVTGQVAGEGLEVDHINRVKDDNRFENLRLATRSQQQINTSYAGHGQYGHRGIRWRADRSKWRAEINVLGRTIGLGHFATKDEAIQAYRAAAVAHFGEFAIQ